jgi:hypothetical protein
MNQLNLTFNLASVQGTGKDDLKKSPSFANILGADGAAQQQPQQQKINLFGGNPN